MEIGGRWRILAAGLSMGLSLCACSLSAPSPSDTVHVADIVNSVKCGLSAALASEAGRRRLPGTIASLELQLKVVDARNLSANTPSTVPLVLAWAGALPQVTPILSGSNQQSFTVDTTINLTYHLDTPNMTLCEASGVDLGDRFGFARWLANILVGLSKVSQGGPRGTLDKLTYDATFAVTREGAIGGSVKVLLIDASATAGRSRADTQRLKIVISGPSSIASSMDGRVTRSHGQSYGGGVPSLSSATPSPR